MTKENSRNETEHQVNLIREAYRILLDEKNRDALHTGVLKYNNLI